MLRRVSNGWQLDMISCDFSSRWQKLSRRLREFGSSPGLILIWRINGVEDGELFVDVAVLGERLDVVFAEGDVAGANRIDGVGVFVQDEHLRAMVVNITKESSFVARSFNKCALCFLIQQITLGAKGAIIGDNSFCTVQ